MYVGVSTTLRHKLWQLLKKHVNFSHQWRVDMKIQRGTIDNDRLIGT